MKKKIKIKTFEFEKFNGIANKSSFLEIKKNIFKTKGIDLIPKEKIVKLNIPWGELYCVCNKEEWDELYEILNSNGVRIKKWTFLDYFLGIWHPVLVFVLYLLFIISLLILCIRGCG